MQARTLSSDESGAGRYRQALASARKAVDIARRAGDAVLEAKAMTHEVEMLHSLAEESNGDATAVTCASTAAKQVIEFCRARNGDPDFLLTNTAMGIEPGRILDTCEAHGWLNLAKLDVYILNAPTAGRDRLIDHTLRLLARVEKSTTEGIVEAIIPIIGCGARQLITASFVCRGEWAEAADAADDLMNYVDSYVESCSDLNPSILRYWVMKAATELSLGPMQQCYDACRRLMGFVIDSAEEEGEHLLRAKWLRELLLITRAQSGDSLRTHRIPPDNATTRELLADISDTLSLVGRGVPTRCAVCARPLALADPDHPIDILECLHTFHSRCLRTHVLGRRAMGASQRGEGGAADDVACPECREPIVLYGRDLELRAMVGIEPPPAQQRSRDRRRGAR